MNLEIRGVHYHISEATHDFIEKKLHRLDFAKEYIVDLTITVTKESHGYKVDGKAHFRWGVVVVVEEEAHELYGAIEIMLDKLEQAVRKEKKKKIDKKVSHKASARAKEVMAEEEQRDFKDEDLEFPSDEEDEEDL